MPQCSMQFEGIGRCFYRSVGYAVPKKGQFYISGAIPAAYRAPADMNPNAQYQIAIPTYRAVTKTIWTRGLKVEEGTYA